MKTLLGSASSLDRTLACPASNQLPQTAPVHPNARAAANLGSAVHTVLEYGKEQGLGVLAKVDEQYSQVAQEILALLPQTAAANSNMDERELSFVYRGETGEAECLGREVNRNYSRVTKLGPKDVTCTVDVVKAGHLIVEVDDYKTGSRTPEPAEAAQLHMGVMCAVKALAPKAKWVVVNFQRVRRDLRKKKDQWGVKDKPALLTRDDLVTFEGRVQRALRVAEQVRDHIAAGRDPQVNEGSWCFFCPARLVCPAKKGK